MRRTNSEARRAQGANCIRTESWIRAAHLEHQSPAVCRPLLLPLLLPHALCSIRSSRAGDGLLEKAVRVAPTSCSLRCLLTLQLTLRHRRFGLEGARKRAPADGSYHATLGERGPEKRRGHVDNCEGERLPATLARQERERARSRAASQG